MPRPDPDSPWSRSNPERRAARIAEYRAARRYVEPPAPPPLSRLQALDADVTQARALAEVEIARGRSRTRVLAALTRWIEGERRWIRATSTPYVIDGAIE